MIGSMNPSKKKTPPAKAKAKAKDTDKRVTLRLSVEQWLQLSEWTLRNRDDTPSLQDFFIAAAREYLKARKATLK